MELGDLLVILTAGFFATYVHLVLALWAGKVGLARLDFSKGMAHLCFGESYDGHPPVMLGFVVVHLNGMFFALLYAYLVGYHLPGPPLIRGLIWGGCLFAGSQLVFNPFVTGHGFFARRMHPRAWLTALLVHTTYGAVLGWLCPVL
ncbi:MAG: hypothetical protein AABZ64_01455 [Nitrospinota bacterium]